MQPHVFIIAEAGVNHNGSIERAKKMVQVAAEAGADAIKFQSFRAENLVTRSAVKAEYQKKKSGAEETQYEMLKKLELSEKAHELLAKECHAWDIDFLSAPFDLISIDLLKKTGIKRWKIPSGEITNLPYLRKIAALGQEIIVSTGMASLEEIRFALAVFEKAGLSSQKISILHCTTEYPTPFKEVNLNAMGSIRRAFPGVNVGYSDHTVGIEVAIAAAALGATVIEKHFTLDRSLPGPDHAASLNPEELKNMVHAIRNIEKSLGSSDKKPSPSEIKNMVVARKSIVAARKIKKGEIFSEMNLTTKRPGTGISPMKWDVIIGKKAAKNYEENDLIDG